MAQQTTGPIPVEGAVQGAAFKANVVRYAGLWRLYLNLAMRRAAGADVGDNVEVVLRWDSTPRRVAVPPAFAKALARDARARIAFEQLAPSRQKEIPRYLGQLKRAETLMRNIDKALRYLRGEAVQGLVALTRAKRDGK
jgi:hypothetical protein